MCTDQKGISIRIGTFNDSFQHSIVEHALKAGYQINIDSFKKSHIAVKTSLQISERIPINKFNPDLNIKDTTIKLNVLS